MFRKIPLLASLLFFLFGTNAFATSQLEESASKYTTLQTEQTIAQSNVNNPATTRDTAADNSKISEETTVLLTKKENVVEPTFIDYVVPGVVALLVIVVFGGYWLIYRRKHV